MCWKCLLLVKACPIEAIDVRGDADFAPLGHSVRVKRDEERVSSRGASSPQREMDLDLLAPITTKPWGTCIPNYVTWPAPTEEHRDSQLLFNEPKIHPHG